MILLGFRAWENAMAAPVPLRLDFDANELRALGKASRDAAQTRQLLALSAIYAGVSVSEQTPSRELRAMGYRKLSASPRHHAQDPGAADAFKKTSPPVWRRSARLSASR